MVKRGRQGGEREEELPYAGHACVRIDAPLSEPPKVVEHLIVDHGRGGSVELLRRLREEGLHRLGARRFDLKNQLQNDGVEARELTEGDWLAGSMGDQWMIIP